MLTREIVRGALPDLVPLPGSGGTRTRYAVLTALGRRDLCLAKLAEPHLDATVILDDLGGPTPGTDSLWAVWAAEPPFARLSAQRGGGGWTLDGTKAFCSGARIVTHALVTATADDGPRLFALDLTRHGISIGAADWVGTGMHRADTRTLTVDHVEADPVGGPGAYTGRPGFWHGAVGIAACWLGGARTVGGTVQRAARARELGPHVLAHLGAIAAELGACQAAIDAAADSFDADPHDDAGAARRTAEGVRATVARTCEDVITRTGRALGPAPLAYDEAHAATVADLSVFIRQHHGERDLETLGALSLEVDW